MATFGAIRSHVYDRVSRSQYYRDNLAGLTAHQRHQRLLAELPEGAGDLSQQQEPDAAAVLCSTISDEDVLRAHHRFLRAPEDDAGEEGASWGARLARRYYARLFKEYAIADLSRYKESKIGMRWRTKAEVVSGKGQFSCGARGCNETAGLASYEVNFAYVEAGQHKQALVKLRLCEQCAHKLNYKKEKQYKKLGLTVMEQQEQQQQRRRQKQQRQGQDKEQQQQKRKHKHKDRGVDSDIAGQQQQQQQQLDRQGQDSAIGSKRRRRSKEDAHSSEHLQQHSAAAVGSREELVQAGSGGAQADRLTEADIDSFLDDMFSSAAAPA